MRHVAWALGLALILAGCPKEKTSPTPTAGAKGSTSPTKNPKAATPKAATPKTGTGRGATASASSPKGTSSSKVTKTFTLAVSAPKAAKVGEDLQATFTLQPHGEYHVNMLYPFSLTVDGPSDVTPKQSVLHKKDAKKFTKTGVVLLHKTKVAKAGDHAFRAQVKFSVCTESHCEVKKETLTWSAKVQ